MLFRSKILRSFVRFVGKRNMAQLKEEHINAFLRRGRLSNSTWRAYRSLFRRFFAYWYARGVITRVPLPDQKPNVPTEFFPYIYFRDEIARLLEAVPLSQIRRRCIIDCGTLRTLLLFLYGTGIQILDTLALKWSNVDLQKGTIDLYPGSFYHHRTLPLGTDVRRLLQRHIVKANDHGDDSRLFQTTSGLPIRYSLFYQTFSRLRALARVSRRNSAFQPRLQDLRHTFAVHSITSWNQKRDNIEKLLPVLAAYMGNVNDVAAERYLKLTPSSFWPQLRRLTHVVAPTSPRQAKEEQR